MPIEPRLSASAWARRQAPRFMRCFTDEELRRGIEAAIVGRHRCVACGGVDDDAHQDQPHTFLAPDVFDVFLQAARGHDPQDVAAGEPDAH